MQTILFLATLSISCLTSCKFGEPPKRSGAPKPPSAEAADPRSQIARRHVDENQVPGLSIAIAYEGSPVETIALGYENLETQSLVRPDTVFQIGSITKQFTAVAILRLVESGKIALDAQLGSYLPEIQGPARSATVRQLLHHTSGIPSYTDMEKWKELMRRDMSPEEVTALFANEPLDFEPGTSFSYSNSGYFLLGRIIEQASGQPYEKFVEEDIIAAAGLRNTSYCSHADLVPHRAAGYERSERGFTNASYLSFSHPYAAGALCSTASELAQWQSALQAGSLLSQGSLDVMTRSGLLSDERATNYGFGVFLGTLGTHPRVFHGGSINGFTSILAYYPKDKLTIAVLANTETTIVGALEEELARLVLNEPLPPLHDAKVPDRLKSALSGHYRSADGLTFSVSTEGNALMGTLDGQPALRLMLQPNGCFIPDLRPVGMPVDRGICIRFGEDRVEILQGGMNTALERLD